jgi:hypothetical protein
MSPIQLFAPTLLLVFYLTHPYIALLTFNIQCLNEWIPKEENVLSGPYSQYPFLVGPLLLVRHMLLPLVQLDVVMWLGCGQWSVSRSAVSRSVIFFLPSPLFPIFPSSLFLFFLWYWGLNFGPCLARQALYYLRYSISPFCVSYFWDRVSLHAQWTWTAILPFVLSHIAGMTGVCHHAPLFLSIEVWFFFRKCPWREGGVCVCVCVCLSVCLSSSCIPSHCLAGGCRQHSRQRSLGYWGPYSYHTSSEGSIAYGEEYRFGASQHWLESWLQVTIRQVT